jgi:hypothetical protein
VGRKHADPVANIRVGFRSILGSRRRGGKSDATTRLKRFVNL